ncbi:MAG: hypothetical protein WC428_00450 [Candidatus Paceibacterota bacterium]
MTEILKVIFGEYTFIQLFGYLWFFIIGYLIYGLTETTGRDIQSPTTPKKWSWKFWFHDNWRRYLTTILCSYILFRFNIEVSGHPFGYFDAISLGLIGDGIAATVKRRVKAIGGDRENLTAQINNENKPAEDNAEHRETPKEEG